MVIIIHSALEWGEELLPWVCDTFLRGLSKVVIALLVMLIPLSTSVYKYPLILLPMSHPQSDNDHSTHAETLQILAEVC
jgi:hypothetical protein